ncbi:unnamed protein product [Cuscuta campestris]|uniref:Uncharacterized protein n=1 Tax=Cuscuta campestris TaxID=132261 RepID=A0A484KCN2_9ASTE|nr:unnamed protein product [Cuscuta campestris]
MSSQSLVFRQSESERDAEGSVIGSAQEIESRSPSVEDIVAAVEVPPQSEPRNQRTGVRPDLARFLLLFRLAKSSGRANSDSGSYASIFQQKEKLFKTRKDSAKSWKRKFIFVSREIMLSNAERVKLMFPDAPSNSSQAPTSGGRPPTPLVKPTSETAQKKKRKETASAADAPQGSESPMMKDFGNPKYVKAAFPARAMMRMVDMSQRLRASEDDQSRAYIEIANLNEALKAAKEQARQASAGGNILTDYRSCLNAESLETLVCNQDWLLARRRAQESSYQLESEHYMNATTDGSPSSEE